MRIGCRLRVRILNTAYSRASRRWERCWYHHKEAQKADYDRVYTTPMMAGARKGGGDCLDEACMQRDETVPDARQCDPPLTPDPQTPTLLLS